jgi:hypothetical protein
VRTERRAVSDQEGNAHAAVDLQEIADRCRLLLKRANGQITWGGEHFAVAENPAYGVEGWKRPYAAEVSCGMRPLYRFINNQGFLVTSSTIGGGGKSFDTFRA